MKVERDTTRKLFFSLLLFIIWKGDVFAQNHSLLEQNAGGGLLSYLSWFLLLFVKNAHKQHTLLRSPFFIVAWVLHIYIHMLVEICSYCLSFYQKKVSPFFSFFHQRGATFDLKPCLRHCLTRIERPIGLL